MAHPLNVKIADTEREKELKRLHQSFPTVTQTIAPNMRFPGLTPPNMGMDSYSYVREVVLFVHYILCLSNVYYCIYCIFIVCFVL